ncbi:hypothetical protein [Butyrivibrio sp. NC3005]|uniref:hypothetical protein n=1 Tax=Butyrivibrio sp. NC3005 TaxID=1280685 RepID=UPI00047D66A2|nr:hypothetical protein [Butyrivibrio sp. NC3005]
MIRFLNDDYSLGENQYKDYRSINELANIIHMQAIKYEMCPSKLLLEKMKETVRRIREDDNKVLSELYSRLECVC